MTRKDFHVYVPLQYTANGKECIDPRAPIYKAQRVEWMQHQSVTPKLLELEAQTRAMTQEMLPPEGEV